MTYSVKSHFLNMKDYGHKEYFQSLNNKIK